MKILTTRLLPLKPLRSLRGLTLVLLGAALLGTLFFISVGVYTFVYRTKQDAWQGRQTEAARGRVKVWRPLWNNCSSC
jgi:hypothetical protein